MISLACSKRREITAAPEPAAKPCPHKCGSACVEGPCPARELAHLEGKPVAIAVNATKVIVRTDAGIQVIDKNTRTVRRVQPPCAGDVGLAASESEIFYVRCGSEVVGIAIADEKYRQISLLKLAIIPQSVVASDRLIGWLAGGRLEIVTSELTPVRMVPRDVRDVKIVGERAFWSMADEAIWTGAGNSAPDRLIQGYDSRGPFAASAHGVLWPNRHDQTLVRLLDTDRSPAWLGYDMVARNATRAEADDEWLYYLSDGGLLHRVAHAHWSEPASVANGVVDIAADRGALYFLSEREGTSVMELDR